MSLPILAADGTDGSTALPANNVTRDELVGFVGDAKGKSGGKSFIQPLEALAVSGPLTVTATGYGAKALTTDKATGRAALENTATLTGSGAVDVTKSMVRLNAAAGAFTLTLGNGTFAGQELAIVFVNGASTATWTASGLTNVLGFTGMVFSAGAHSAKLKWDLTAAKWFYMGGNVLLS